MAEEKEMAAPKSGERRLLLNGEYADVYETRKAQARIIIGVLAGMSVDEAKRTLDLVRIEIELKAVVPCGATEPVGRGGENRLRAAAGDDDPKPETIEEKCPCGCGAVRIDAKKLSEGS